MCSAYVVGGHPIQETTTVTAVPERPKLMGLDEDAEDVEVDDAKLVSKPSPRSPEEEKRHRIRIKRLTRLSSDEIGEGPFEEGHMVHVKSMGYGVIKWLGQRNKGLIAGIEFVSIIDAYRLASQSFQKKLWCPPHVKGQAVSVSLL